VSAFRVLPFAVTDCTGLRSSVSSRSIASTLFSSTRLHPLYRAVDHIECGNVERGCQVVCYALNDVKGHIPFECFEALKRTTEWKELMEQWREQAEKNPHDRQAFRGLIFPNDSRKK